MNLTYVGSVLIYTELMHITRNMPEVDVQTID
jgi:hypothetical protein